MTVELHLEPSRHVIWIIQIITMEHDIHLDRFGPDPAATEYEMSLIIFPFSRPNRRVPIVPHLNGRALANVEANEAIGNGEVFGTAVMFAPMSNFKFKLIYNQIKTY